MLKKEIYSHADNSIRASMRFLREVQGFSYSETTWEATIVEDKEVVFRVHHKVAELIRESYKLIYSEQSQMRFEELESTVTQITVYANGVESYFFARALRIAVDQIRGNFVSVKKSNREILLNALEEAIKKAGHEPGKYKTVIRGDLPTIKLPSPVLTFPGDNVDMVTKDIMQSLPELLKFHAGLKFDS